MTVTEAHHHDQQCDLLATLALPHGTPVIEWHTPGPVPAPPTPDPTPPPYVEVEQQTTATLTLPGTAVEGGLVIVTASAWEPGSIVAVTDPRLDLLYGTTAGDWRVWTGRLVSTGATAWDDPVVVTASDSAVLFRTAANLVTYPPAVAVGRSAVTVTTDGDKLEPVPTLTDVAAVCVVSRAYDGTVAGADVTGGASYTHVGVADATKTRTVFHHWSNGGTVAATNPAETFQADGTAGHLGLVTVELVGDTSTIPDGDNTGTYWVDVPDRTAALVAYAATHGRTNPAEAPGPLAASVTLARHRVTGPIPSPGERFRLTLSATVAAALGVTDAERPRFTGEVTTSRLDWADDLTPVRVDGVGRSNRLARIPFTANRPAETDGERVRRVLHHAAILLPTDIGTIDPGTVTLLPEEFAGTATGQAVDQARVDSLGYLIEHRSGRLDWHDAEHRRATPSSVTLTGTGHLIRPFAWERTTGTLTNDAEVTYGDPQARVRVTDAASADPDTGVGPYAVQLVTRLAGQADAYALASTIVGRYAAPAWTIPDLGVDIVRTAATTAAAVLSLSCGDKITATGLPPDGPFTAGDLFVEATAETFTADAWRVSLTASDPAVSGVGLRWQDVDTFILWQSVAPTLRWLDAATLEDGTVGDQLVDGGDAASTTWAETLDGDDATPTHTATLDAGAAA